MDVRLGDLRRRLQGRLRSGVVRLVASDGDAVRQAMVGAVVDSSIRFAEKAIGATFFGRQTALTTDRVEKKYDALAGSYLRNIFEDDQRRGVYWMGGDLEETTRAKFQTAMMDEMAAVLRQYRSTSILEVGAGELTTLAEIAERLGPDRHYHGVDLSFDRVYQGAYFFGRHRSGLRAARANALRLPYGDDSFDVVFTSHCLEHIPLDYERAIDEMVRVAKRAVVLFEPSYELNGMVQKMRMRANGYVRGIDAYVQSLAGVSAGAPRLLDNAPAFNRTACHRLDIEGVQSGLTATSPAPKFACPRCTVELEQMPSCLVCDRCRVAYPVIDGVAALDERDGYSIRRPPVQLPALREREIG